MNTHCVGANVDVSCTVTRNGTSEVPMISWSPAGAQLTSGARRLLNQISPLRASDAKTYTCEADFNSGASGQESINITAER